MTNEPAPIVPTASDTQMNDAGNYQVCNLNNTTVVPRLTDLETQKKKQSDTTASSSSSDAPPSPAAAAAAASAATVITTPPPCALLESLTRSYDPDGADDGGLQTTCGEYLELIYIHREAFAALPSAHVGCSAAFSALARALELRAWRADRDADAEAVAAFRHEAWMVAAWMSSGGPWWRGGEKIPVD